MDESKVIEGEFVSVGGEDIESKNKRTALRCAVDSYEDVVLADGFLGTQSVLDRARAFYVWINSDEAAS